MTAYAQCGLSHNGSHAIDAMRYLALDGNVSWLFGELESDAAAAAEEEDPQGNGYFAFDNGARGYLRAMPTGAATAWEFDVLGSEGRVRLLEQSLQFELWKSVPGGPRGRPQPARLPFPYPTHIQGMGLTIVDDILTAAESGGKPRCSGADARDALEIAVALRESHRRGFTRVDLPLADRSLGIRSAEIGQDHIPARVRRLQG